MARKKKTVELDREHEVAPGLVAKTKKRLVVASGRSHHTLAEDVATLESYYEPFLLQAGFLARTPRGRVATRRAYELLGRQAPQNAAEQGSLF